MNERKIESIAIIGTSVGGALTLQVTSMINSDPNGRGRYLKCSITENPFISITDLLDHSFRFALESHKQNDGENDHYEKIPNYAKEIILKSNLRKYFDISHQTKEKKQGLNPDTMNIVVQIVQKLADYIPYSYVQFVTKYILYRVGIPDGVEDLEFTPLKKVENISTPTLFVHGTNDHVTPLWHTIVLYEKLKNGEKDYLIIEGGEHAALYNGKHKPLYEEKVVSFLRKYLPFKKKE